MAEAKKSMKFGDKEYRFVPDRIKQFREQNPRGGIDTNPTYNADGSITFKAVITTDNGDPSAAVGTGTARYSAEELKKPKAFEKLETISVGRALAILGYLNDGQVASTEEMQEFYDYRDQQHAEAVQNAIEAMGSAKTLDELKDAFIASELMFDDKVIAAKDDFKSKLGTPPAPKKARAAKPAEEVKE